MEKLDYKIIDPFCIPVIRFLREEKGIETMYCCQGKTSEDDPEEHHSKRGYIMAKYSEESFKELLKIFNSHASRIPYNEGERMGIKIRRHPEFKGNVIIVKLVWKTWPTKESLKEEWDLIFSDLTRTQD